MSLLIWRLLSPLGSVKKHVAVSNPLPIANTLHPAGTESEKALQPSREAGVGRVGTQATCEYFCSSALGSIVH
jgi:hypothetical protein